MRSGAQDKTRATLAEQATAGQALVTLAGGIINGQRGSRKGRPAHEPYVGLHHDA